jgi:hypothetical protein
MRALDKMMGAVMGKSPALIVPRQNKKQPANLRRRAEHPKETLAISNLYGGCAAAAVCLVTDQRL